MIQSVSAASSYQPPPPSSTVRSSGSGALPEVASPFEIAQQIQEVQVTNLKRTLDAQTMVLDLLV